MIVDTLLGRGHKIFWLVPPTDKNLLLYEKWVKEQTEKTHFFGDLAEGCCRLEIWAGSLADSLFYEANLIIFFRKFSSYGIPVQDRVRHFCER